MAANGGRHQLGPESGRLTLRTYRSGLAAQAGHDLTIDVIRWQADIDLPARNFTADTSAVPNNEAALAATIDLTSLAIREGHGGIKPLTARDARTIVEIAQNIGAIHLIACCQALELRGVEHASPRTQEAFRLVREHVPFLDRDRYLDVDIATTVALIQSGAMSGLLG